MLLIAATILCLLGSFGTSQYRSTGGRVVDAKDSGNQPADSKARCLLNCGFHHMDRNRMDSNGAFKAASRQSCFEKCLESNKQDKLEFYEKGSSIVEPFSKRKRRNVNDGLVDEICPSDATYAAKNKYATVENINYEQYENSNRWYYNISWKPLNESFVNFTQTGYAFIYWNNYLPSNFVRYISRQKNETFVTYDEPESSIVNDDLHFKFCVIALPCQSIADIEFNETLYPRNVTNRGISTSTPTETLYPRNVTNRGISTPTPTDSPTINKTVYVIIVIGTLAVIITIACVLRYKYFREGGRRHSDLSSCPADFCYDAFIIFNNKDQSWVDETLLPILEVKHGLKCCVHYRDFEPGKPFVENMTDSVQKSRNTIAVVSKNFFTSKFCKYELDQAIYKNVKEGCNSAIVIRIDNVSKDKLPNTLKNKSFVDYSNLIERKTWHLKLIKVLQSNHVEMESRV